MILNHVKILYAISVLSLCGVLVLSFLYVHAPQQSLGVGSVANKVGQLGDPTLTPAAQQAVDITVGNNADNPAAVKLGPITQISGGVVTMKDILSGQTYTVSTNANTKILFISSQKDPAEYQKEMDAYYAHIKLLMQDPAKNKAALGALVIPLPVELKPDTLADLAVGDSVEVSAASPITGKSFTAVKIIKSPSVPR